MPLVILGVTLAVGLLLILRGFVAADPKSLVRIVQAVAVGLCILTVTVLALSGRLPLVLPLVTVLVPLYFRWRDIRQRQRAARGPSARQTSRVETATLAMELDHDSGRMAGWVRSGRLAGRRLADLSQADLAALLDECRRHDPAATQLLEAWLDRNHPHWRYATGPERPAQDHADPPVGEPARMTRAQAYEVLGLEPGAGIEAIRQAHRRLMQRVHPDLGGSTYLAARINQARDVLLKD